jgi:metal-responsive CopG/Arc/MetJ family transcriptional regulator
MATVKPKKKRGPPPTGKTPVTALRIPDDVIVRIDRWARANGIASRSEAIRRMIDIVLDSAGDGQGGPNAPSR